MCPNGVVPAPRRPYHVGNENDGERVEPHVVGCLRLPSLPPVLRTGIYRLVHHQALGLERVVASSESVLKAVAQAHLLLNC
jgi:hypothetical protein